MFKILFLIIKIILYLILFLIINFIILIIINYKNFNPDDFFEQCNFKKVFKENTYTWEFLLSDWLRDPSRYCSFSLLETEKNLKNFSKIDEKYFKNHKINFSFEIIENHINMKERNFSKKELDILKNIKNTLKTWEKEEEVVYKIFKIYENLEDYEICYYKKSENKGYCIVNHM